MYRVRVVKDYEAETLITNSTNGLKRVVDGHEANYLAVKLVDALEVEDLRMDLFEKKVY